MNMNIPSPLLTGVPGWVICGWGLAMALATPVLAAGTESIQPLSPAQERATFQFADPGLTAEWVAAEPQVNSPVAMAWDAAGTLFVAEMRDYPNSRDGGAIRRLVDRDGDGRYETSTVFADRLPFPNSVLPWNGGVLVTAAPDLWFLRDGDGDGVAEERRVLFTGFGTGNQQLRANGLLWGTDGWIYGANGRSDGEVRRVYDPAGWVKSPVPVEVSRATNAVSLRGRDFRFRPDTGEFETLAGRSQFGHGVDDWGNRFLSWNTIPLRHEVFPDRFLAGRPELAAIEVLQDTLPSGDRGEVFPQTPPPLVFNNESGSHFNALSGLYVYRGDALGADYDGNAFVGESLRNLVHRRVLVAEGPTFRAERREQGREFLSSTDPWFHPVNFATGPDGALYVADFYRRFVEHPDWVAREMRERVAWDAGREHGRIWRIRRRDVPDSRSGVPLASAGTATLVEELGSANGWRRDTAHRLLAERRDPAAIAALRSTVRESASPRARISALHLLDILGALGSEELILSLKSSDHHFRAAAVRMVADRGLAAGRKGPESFQAMPGLRAAVIEATGDPDAAVRLWSVLALGTWPSTPELEQVIDRVGQRETNRWLVLAAGAASTATNLPWLSKAGPTSRLQRPPPRPARADPDRERVVSTLRPALQLAGDRSRGAALCSKLCLACHYLQGQGQRVGPDLAGLGGRPTETILTDILDPSRQVAPDYQAYEFVLADDSRVTGLIASESETRITVRQPGTPDVSLARSQVREVRSTGGSLMPDGLEAGLSPQDLADLLAFLRAPDGALLPH